MSQIVKIEGDPDLALTVRGEGPISDVTVAVALDADGARVAGGDVTLLETDEGQSFDVDLSGGFAPLVPSPYRGFFAGDTAVRATGVSKTEGGVRLDTLAVTGAELTLDGRLETGAGNGLQSLRLTGALGDPSGPPVLLPVPGGDTTLNAATLYVNFGQSSRWDGLVVLDRLNAGQMAFEDVTLDMGGLARDLADPEARLVTVTLEGIATGITSTDPAIDRALGPRLDLFADMRLPATGPITLDQFQIAGEGLSVFSAGSFDDGAFTGRASLRAPDLVVLSGLANRPLAGAVELRAEGSVTPLSGGFDLAINGSTDRISVDDPRLDALLAGETNVSGRAVRDADGLRTEDLRIENPQLRVASDGTISLDRTDFTLDAEIVDIGVIDPRAEGRLELTGRASGEGMPVGLELDARLAEGRILDNDVTGLDIGFSGSFDQESIAGSLRGEGQLDALVLDLAGEVSADRTRQEISGLRLALGPSLITGDLTRVAGTPLDGTLTFRSPDIAPLAALALVEATGSIDAEVTLSEAETGQGAALRATGSDLEVPGAVIGGFEADIDLGDAFGQPRIDGTLSARDVLAAGFEINALDAEARQIEPDRMTFDLRSRLAVGTLASLGGELEWLDDGFSATLSSLDIRQGDVAATLGAPATVTMAGGNLDLSPLALDVGGGRLTAAGRVAESFDVAVDISALPLSIANTIRPALGLAGEVTGTARITGPRDAPDVDFDLSGTGLAAATTRAAGLPAFALNARGETAGTLLALDAELTAPGGLSARASGDVPLGTGGALDLAIDLQALPLALVDRAAGGAGLGGTLTGTAAVTGTLAAPQATFSMEGSGLTANALRTNGVPPLGLAVSGSFANNAVTLASADLTGAPGLALSASGTVPLAGAGLNVTASGTVPLQLANPILEQRQAQAEGVLRIDATATGSITAPQLTGAVNLEGGTLTDPSLNLRLNNINLAARLTGDRVVLDEARADLSAGGSISAGGSLGLSAAAGFPADLTVNFNDARYTDGAFVSTEANGQLTLRGPIQGGGGVLAGQIDLGRTEISISEGLGGNAGAVLEEVTHVRPPARVTQTLQRAEVGEPAPPQATGRSGIQLDVLIRAPNQIFVRGRGLDAELGGEVRLTGPTTDIQPVGQFDLRRGRISILTQRIDFTRGAVTLAGDLDPTLDFEARSRSGDVTAIVQVRGRASDPDITFTSEPELPEDEVLARLLFNAATADLSPFQLAQLAAAAAELAGGGGGGLLSQLRVGNRPRQPRHPHGRERGDCSARRALYFGGCLSRRTDRQRWRKPPRRGDRSERIRQGAGLGRERRQHHLRNFLRAGFLTGQRRRPCKKSGS